MSAVLDLVREMVPPEAILNSDLNELADAIAFSIDAATLRTLHVKVADEIEREKFSKFESYFPADYHEVGKLKYYPRHLYPRHLEHFKAGRTFRERCFMAANRVGKTVAGAFEVTCHLTGIYPSWWEGRVFRRPVRVWVAGDTNETTRDVLQIEQLLGPVIYDGPRKMLEGSGMIPREHLGVPKWKQGVADFVDTIPVKHKSGGWSLLGFKSYDQGRKVFQGTAKEIIWLDEEAPQDVYGECLIRTATTRGMVITTFTPLLGISEVVKSFLPKDFLEGK